jgi:competence protein ComEC
VLQVPLPAPSPWQLAVLTVATVAMLVTRGRRRAALALCATAALVLLELHVRAEATPRGRLRATFFDVGQGDSALVDLPDGSAMLIDGGGLVGSPTDVGTRVLGPVLRARRRSALDLVVLSHPHPDHYGGLDRGLGAVRVGAFWDTGQGEREGAGGAYASVLARLRAQGTPIEHAETLCGHRAFGGAELDVLGPCPGPSAERGPNDNSFVLRIRLGNRAFLFTGDAEREEEGDLLREARGRLAADVLKVGHHGSRTSTSPAFVAAVHPSLAIVSTGVRNRFGHPHATTMSTLAAAGVRALRTDETGEIVVETDGTGLWTRTASVDGAPGSL